jgi:hypothetical protein
MESIAAEENRAFEKLNPPRGPTLAGSILDDRET